MVEDIQNNPEICDRAQRIKRAIHLTQGTVTAACSIAWVGQQKKPLDRENALWLKMMDN